MPKKKTIASKTTSEKRQSANTYLHTYQLDIPEGALNERERRVLYAIREHGPVTVRQLRRLCWIQLQSKKGTYEGMQKAAAGARAVRNALRRLVASALVTKGKTTPEKDSKRTYVTYTATQRDES